MLRIQEYTVADLKHRLDHGPWFAGNPVPITKHRALSHVNNPRADGSDVALLVAYDGDTVVAHLGILPDLVFCNQAPCKIGWLTAWWANPDRKYAGVGLMLLSRAFAFYGGALGASGFSASASRVYEATKKFVTIGEREGIEGLSRLDLSRLLSRRLPWIGRCSGCLKVLNAVVNQYNNLRHYWWLKRHALPQEFRLEYIPKIDSEADEFIRRYSTLALARRGAKELNWIAGYPWVLNAPLESPSSFRFSSFAKSYAVFNIKVYNRDQRLVAVLMVTVIDGHAIVPFCVSERQSGLVAQILAHILIAQHIERLTLYQKELVDELLVLRFPWLWLRNKRRAWIMSGDSAEVGAVTYAIQDGDGDCAFTA